LELQYSAVASADYCQLLSGL